MSRTTLCVDISAKIEAWDKGSAVAVSNSLCHTLWVPADLKQRARLQIRGAEPAQFVLMAALAFLALRPLLHHAQRIVLDRDYSGDTANRIIIRRLTELIRNELPQFKSAHIRVDEVAGSQADRIAREICTGEREADSILVWEDLEVVLRK